MAVLKEMQWVAMKAVQKGPPKELISELHWALLTVTMKACNSETLSALQMALSSERQWAGYSAAQKDTQTADKLAMRMAHCWVVHWDDLMAGQTEQTLADLTANRWVAKLGQKKAESWDRSKVFQTAAKSEQPSEHSWVHWRAVSSGNPMECLWAASTDTMTVVTLVHWMAGMKAGQMVQTMAANLGPMWVVMWG